MLYIVNKFITGIYDDYNRKYDKFKVDSRADKIWSVWDEFSESVQEIASLLQLVSGKKSKAGMREEGELISRSTKCFDAYMSGHFWTIFQLFEAIAKQPKHIIDKLSHRVRVSTRLVKRLQESSITSSEFHQELTLLAQTQPALVVQHREKTVRTSFLCSIWAFEAKLGNKNPLVLNMYASYFRKVKIACEQREHYLQAWQLACKDAVTDLDSDHDLTLSIMNNFAQVAWYDCRDLDRAETVAQILYSRCRNAIIQHGISAMKSRAKFMAEAACILARQACNDPDRRLRTMREMCMIRRSLGLKTRYRSHELRRVVLHPNLAGVPKGLIFLAETIEILQRGDADCIRMAVEFSTVLAILVKRVYGHGIAEYEVSRTAMLRFVCDTGASYDSLGPYKSLLSLYHALDGVNGSLEVFLEDFHPGQETEVSIPALGENTLLYVLELEKIFSHLNREAIIRKMKEIRKQKKEQAKLKNQKQPNNKKNKKNKKNEKKLP